MIKNRNKYVDVLDLLDNGKICRHHLSVILTGNVYEC